MRLLGILLIFVSKPILARSIDIQPGQEIRMGPDVVRCRHQSNRPCKIQYQWVQRQYQLALPSGQVEFATRQEAEQAIKSYLERGVCSSVTRDIPLNAP